MYKQLISDWQIIVKKLKFIPREYMFPMDLLSLDKIISFVWARRVGKTTIMKQVIHQLIESRYMDYTNVIWLDANEVNPMTFDMNALLVSYFELYPDLQPFIVIDEVHELPDRVRQVFIAYNKGYKIFISWSNANLLSTEISTKLRGKVYEQYISGLSWSEYCRFTDYQNNFTTPWLGEKNKIFEEYIIYGWFPEVALSKDPTIKTWLLKNYFEVLLYKDLIERYHIDKEFVIKYLIKYLSLTITKEFSVTTLINQLKSQWVSITKPSIYNYLEYLQNIFFIYPLRQQHRQRWAIKWYLNDTGYSTLREKEWIGKKFENFIINCYKKPWVTLAFDVNKGWEIDLSLEKQDIQICRKLTPENLMRETQSLLHSKKNPLLIYHQKDEWLVLPDWIQYRQVFDVLH